MNLQDLQSNYGISAKKITVLRSNVAIIESDENIRYIIKRIRISNTNKWIDKHRFQNELRIYKQLNEKQFKILNSPKLYANSDQHMVIQFVEKDPNLRTKSYEFVRAYCEMQTIDVPKDFGFDFKNQLVRGFLYRGLVIPLFTLSKHLKALSILKMVLLYLKLELSVKKLTNRYWLHGDLTNQNVYHNLQDGKLYFLDFENLFYTRKWPLIEIIQKCIWLKDGGYGFVIDLKKLKYYLDIVKDYNRQDLTHINMQKQFRFALLMTSINSIAIAKSKIKRESFIQLLNILIDTKAYHTWFSKFIKPELLKNKII